jgi:hypothetical protein
MTFSNRRTPRAGCRALPVFLAVLFFSGLACLKSPKPPSWDTQLTLPLTDNTFRLMDILPGKYFSVNADSSVQFQAQTTIDTIRPISTLAVSGQPFASSFHLSDLALSGAGSARVKLGLEEVLGVSLPEEPTVLPVPGFEFSLDRSFALDRIRQADLLRGTVRIELANYSNVPLDSLVADNVLTGMCRFAPVEANSGTRTNRSLRAGQVTSQNPLQLRGGGAGVAQALVSSRDSMVLTVEFDSLRLSSAELKVPQARASKKLFLGVAANHPFTLDSALFSAGRAEVKLNNSFPFPVNITLRIPKLGYCGDVPVGPGATQTVNIDLAGRALSNNGLTNSLLDVNSSLAVAAGEDYCSITKDQSLALASQMQDLVPDFLAGDLRQPMYVTAPQETMPQFFPTGLPALRLPGCMLTLKLVSAIGFRARLNLHIFGINKTGDTARIDQTVYIAPGSPEFPNLTEEVIPLRRVMNIGPEHLYLTYDIGVSGRGSIEKAGYSTGQAAVSTPLRLALCADTIDLGGRVVEIDQGVRDKIARYLVAGEINADIGNHFPLGMNACVTLKPVLAGPDSSAGGGERESDIRSTDTLAIPVGIPAGGLSRDRTCQSRTDTTVVGTVDETSLAIFHSPKIRVGIRLFMPETDTVVLRGQDYFRLATRAVLKLRVGGRDE